MGGYGSYSQWGHPGREGRLLLRRGGHPLGVPSHRFVLLPAPRGVASLRHRLRSGHVRHPELDVAAHARQHSPLCVETQVPCQPQQLHGHCSVWLRPGRRHLLHLHCPAEGRRRTCHQPDRGACMSMRICHGCARFSMSNIYFFTFMLLSYSHFKNVMEFFIIM